MPRRVDLYMREKRPRDGSGRKAMTPARAWKAVAGLIVVCTGLAVVFWMTGMDFSSERRLTPLFSTNELMGGEPQGIRLSACGVVRVVAPDWVDEAVPCAWWNLGTFYVMPLIGVAYAIKITLLGR